MLDGVIEAPILQVKSHPGWARAEPGLGLGSPKFSKAGFAPQHLYPHFILSIYNIKGELDLRTQIKDQR